MCLYLRFTSCNYRKGVIIEALEMLVKLLGDGPTYNYDGFYERFHKEHVNVFVKTWARRFKLIEFQGITTHLKRRRLIECRSLGDVRTRTINEMEQTTCTNTGSRKLCVKRGRTSSSR